MASEPLAIDMDEDPPDRHWPPTMRVAGTFAGPNGKAGIEHHLHPADEAAEAELDAEFRRAGQLCSAAEPHLTAYDGPCLGHVDEARRQLGSRASA